MVHSAKLSRFICKMLSLTPEQVDVVERHPTGEVQGPLFAFGVMLPDSTKTSNDLPSPGVFATSAAPSVAPNRAAIAVQKNVWKYLAQNCVQMPLQQSELDFLVEVTLDAAESKATEQNFLEAQPACRSSLAQAALWNVLQGVCEFWNKFEHLRFKQHQDEVRSITAQLMAARDRSDALRKLNAEKDAQLMAACDRSDALRSRVEKQFKEDARKLRVEKLLKEESQRESSHLKKELSEARRALAAPLCVSREAVVKQMAGFECQPLQSCTPSERAALKKKLLLKWHPDKQPCHKHVTLSTQVMQELQNRPEWNTDVGIHF